MKDPSAWHDFEALKIAIIVPVFNEEQSVVEFSANLQSYLNQAPFHADVIMVNDGSTDDTPTLLKDSPFAVLHHEVNLGYGAAIKTGIDHCDHDIIVIMDADGTYLPEEIEKILKPLLNCEMSVGARTGLDAHIPLIRRPAKWLIRIFASWLVRRSIPDLNSGLRAFRRKDAIKIQRLLPDGFSLTTTMTIAFLSMGKRVHYQPIQYKKRQGKSKFHPFKDTWNLIMLILRTVVLLRPLNVFVPLSFLLMILALLVLFFSKHLTGQFMDATFIVLVMAAIQMFVLGLIADLIVRINLWTH